MQGAVGGVPLAASRLNRDEVLYRAGWAAAEARLTLGESPSLEGRARGGIADLCFDSQLAAEATVVNPSPVPSLRGRGERRRVVVRECGACRFAGGRGDVGDGGGRCAAGWR